MTLSATLAKFANYITSDGKINGATGIEGTLLNDTSGNSATATTASNVATGIINSSSFATTAKSPLAGVADTTDVLTPTAGAIGSIALLNVNGFQSGSTSTYPSINLSIGSNVSNSTSTQSNYVYGVNLTYQGSEGGTSLTWNTSILPTNDQWNRIIFGNGVFLATTLDGLMDGAVSAYGFNWLRTYDTYIPRSNTTFINGLFIRFLSTNYVGISTDAINWTTININPGNVITANALYSFSYGNGKFFAFYGGGASSSTDGMTWTAQPYTLGSPRGLVAFGNGTFIGVDGTQTIYKSTDGLTWTTQTVSGSNSSSIIYAGGLFILQGSSRYFVSTDGITWAEITIPNIASGTSNIAYGDGLFFVANQNSTVGATSTDGINWTQITIPYGSWGSVAYGNNTFVSVGGYYTTALYGSRYSVAQGTWQVMTDIGNVSWTSSTSPTEKILARRIS